jgi:hypothetical protein
MRSPASCAVPARAAAPTRRASQLRACCEPSGRAAPIKGVGEPVRDGPYNAVMISLFRLALGTAIGYQAQSPLWRYEGLVDISQRLHRSGASQEARIARVAEVFNRFHPPQQPQLLQNNRLSMDTLALLTERLFPFLVGPCKAEPWVRDDGTVWNSKVAIERCRFLEASGCKSMCVGLCKTPSEAYFESIGLPLSFTPNFTTGGCEMVWGRTPTDQDLADEDLSCFAACDMRGLPPLERAPAAASAHFGASPSPSPSPEERPLPSGGVRFTWTPPPPPPPPPLPPLPTSSPPSPLPPPAPPSPPPPTRTRSGAPRIIMGLRGGEGDGDAGSEASAGADADADAPGSRLPPPGAEAEEASVDILPAGERGMGAYAAAPLAAGQWIGRYVGTPVTLLQTAQRYTDTDPEYLFQITPDLCAAGQPQHPPSPTPFNPHLPIAPRCLLSGAEDSGSIG